MGADRFQHNQVFMEHEKKSLKRTTLIYEHISSWSKLEYYLQQGIKLKKPVTTNKINYLIYGVILGGILGILWGLINSGLSNNNGFIPQTEKSNYADDFFKYYQEKTQNNGNLNSHDDLPEVSASNITNGLLGKHILASEDVSLPEVSNNNSSAESYFTDELLDKYISGNKGSLPAPADSNIPASEDVSLPEASGNNSSDVDYINEAFLNKYIDKPKVSGNNSSAENYHPLKLLKDLYPSIKDFVLMTTIGKLVYYNFRNLVIGALIGYIFGWVYFLKQHKNFGLENIKNKFKETKIKYEQWQLFDEQQTRFEKEQKERDIRKAEVKRERYLIQAKDKWYKFYKFKNFSNLDKLSGYEFEIAIADLYENSGYAIEVTKASGDFGVDIIAKKDEDVLAIQAKRYKGKVSVDAVQEVHAGASFYRATQALVVTNSFFTEQAKKLAKKIGVILIDKKQLIIMWDSVNPSKEIPAFNLQQYENMKMEIDKSYYRYFLKWRP